MKTKSGLAAAVGVLMLFGATAARADLVFCVSITSVSGQKIEGTATNPCATRIRGLTFDYGVTKPWDVSTGRSGPRTHKAVRIAKEWDAASVHIFNALVRNEPLETVVFDFFVISAATGANVLDHTITLRNASVTSIEHKNDAMVTSKGSSSPGLENVEFAFQGIDLDDHKSKTSATDSLQAR